MGNYNGGEFNLFSFVTGSAFGTVLTAVVQNIISRVFKAVDTGIEKHTSKDARIGRLMCNLVRNQPLIESVQLYEVEQKHEKGFYEYHVRFSGAECKRGVEINALLRAVYRIDEKSFDLWDEVVKSIPEWESYDKESIDLIFNYLMDSLSTICENEKAKLDRVHEPSDITPDYCTGARLLVLCEQLIGIIDEKNRRVNPIAYDGIGRIGLRNEDIEQLLLSKKRTGILGAVLLDRPYIFRNQRNGFNHKRVYVAFPAAGINGKLVIVLLSLCLAKYNELTPSMVNAKVIAIKDKFDQINRKALAHLSEGEL